jgi:diguanylate cyclase (GGDEF)-like protein/PAS domain S-box-containing protein
MKARYGRRRVPEEEFAMNQNSPNPTNRAKCDILALDERIAQLGRSAVNPLGGGESSDSRTSGPCDFFLRSPGAYALHALIQNEHGRPVDFRCLEVNSAFELLMDRAGDEMLGCLASELFSATEVESMLPILAEVAQGQEPTRFEHDSRALGKCLDITAFSPRQGQFATIISDVTHRRRTEETLRVRTAYFKQLFESSPFGIVLLDNSERIIECNQGFEELFGFSRDEARGQAINRLIVGDDQFSDARLLAEKVLQGELVDAEGVRYRRNGQAVDVRILAHPIHLDEKQIGIYGIYSDISRRKRDGLTQLVNRATFMEMLGMELERATRTSKLTAVLTLDLDHLKDVNDTYGWHVGDALLVGVAERLRGTLRAGTSIARLGGDEFGVLQVDLADAGNAAGLARRLLASLEAPIEVAEQTIHVGARVGIAVAESGGVANASQVLAQAERALAEAKAEGRRRYKFHAVQMDRDVQDRMLLGQELHNAIDRDELYLEYQPQIALPEQRLVGVEALLRWRHPSGRKVGPDQFIPVAEACGMIVPIGNWVLRTACAQAVEWQRSFSLDVPVAVNLSAVQFKDPAFSDSVISTLEETGLRPDMLELELTERILIQATEVVTRTLSRLQDLGVRLALDDFGKGYSSLEYIRLLPLQKLKIDRSFINRLEEDGSDAAIVSAITVLGSKLGLTVLAEGVERQSQLDLLAQEGCHEIQGFYFSPPVAPEKVTELMTEGDGYIRPASLVS